MASNASNSATKKYIPCVSHIELALMFWLIVSSEYSSEAAQLRRM